MDEAVMGMENALKTNPKDIEQLYQKKTDDLHVAYGEAMLENKFIKSCTASRIEPVNLFV